MKNDQEFVPDEWAEGLPGRTRLIKANIRWCIYSRVRIPHAECWDGLKTPLPSIWLMVES